MSALERRRVLVTRPAEQAQGVCSALSAMGATPIVLPLLTIEPDTSAARSPVWGLIDTYDWIVFTSANGVKHGWPHAAQALQRHSHIAVVGPVTASAVTAREGRVQHIAPLYVAESLVNTLDDVAEASILWIRGNDARDVLGPRLRERGARVDECVVYQTRPAALPADAADHVRAADVATFASPSAVRRFVECFGTSAVPQVVCIGPVTAAAARAAGLRVDAVAESYTTDGLVHALALLDA